MTEASPHTAPQQRTRPWVVVTVGLIFSGTALAVLLRNIDWEKLFAAWAQSRWWFLLFLPVAEGTAIGLNAVRARFLFQAYGAPTLLTMIRARLVVLVGNDLLPMRLGEWLRILYIRRETGVSIASALALTALERVLDTVVFASVFLLAAAHLPHLGVPPVALRRVATVAAGALVVLAAILSFLKISGRAERYFNRGTPLSSAIQLRLRELHRAVDAWRTAGKTWSLLMLHGAYGCIAMASWQATFLAFDISIPWYAPCVTIGFVAFGSMLPSAPAAVGLYHAAAVAALATFRVPVETALAAATSAHAITVTTHLVLGAHLLPNIFSLRRSGTDAPSTDPAGGK